MIPVLEAVPNFSEGRDGGFIRELVAAVEVHDVEVLDVSSDRDHHRSVLTYVGAPAPVEEASVDAAVLAAERIDLNRHVGVHPRVGALDVLPFVPLHDLTMDEAVDSAHRVGEALRARGIPVYFYGAASFPPGRKLFELRRGGFEALRGGFPPGREPDLGLPAEPGRPHPTAGVTCVGARDVLLAWNVFVRGVGLGPLKGLADSIRETGGGFPHLRALAVELPESGRYQISMNLENPEATSPVEVLDRISVGVGRLGGEVVGTEVIGMIPNALVFQDSESRLKLLGRSETRFLSERVKRHVVARSAERRPGPQTPSGDG
jgi:glutamate formiminotransferase / 5-formyltetrahydrofolate cyclo-ligase